MCKIRIGSFLMATAFLVVSPLHAQGVPTIQRKPVPKEVFQDAVPAVQKLGQETLKGNHAYAFEKMYPRMRKRAAKTMGGEAAVQRALANVSAEMEKMGVQLVSFVAEPALSAFDVPEFKEWIVFVPTVRTIRGIDENGRVLTKEVRDYQVAVQSQVSGEWTFINGSTLKIKELRSLFPSLPADRDELALPELSVR